MNLRSRVLFSMGLLGTFDYFHKNLEGNGPAAFLGNRGILTLLHPQATAQCAALSPSHQPNQRLAWIPCRWNDGTPAILEKVLTAPLTRFLK